MKTILVTGANKGIGKEICRQLANKGHNVILTARNEEAGRKTLQELNNKNLRFRQMDISDKNSIASVRDHIKREFGSLDVLINNAGINYDTWHSASDADLENVRETLETNLFGAWHTVQILLPMLKKGKDKRIINVSSGAGSLYDMSGSTPGYSVSKAGLNVLTIKLADELKEEGISVNSVCPGWVRTNMGGDSAPRSVEEGASGIVWLAVEASHDLTGKFFRDGEEIRW